MSSGRPSNHNDRNRHTAPPSSAASTGRARPRRHNNRASASNGGRRVFPVHHPEVLVQADETDRFSEAEEVREEEENAEGGEEEEDEDGEDLFGEGLMRDYEPRPDLDHYDPALIDDSTEIPMIRPSERRRVERVLRARDRRDAGLRRERDPTRPPPYQGIIDLLGGEEEEEEDEVWRLLRDRRERLREGADRAGRFPVQQAEQAKDELPYCTGKAAWTERVGEILQVVFSGFLYLYVRLNNQTVLNSMSTRTATETEQAENSVLDSQQRDEGQQNDISTREGTYLESIHDMANQDAECLVVLWDDLRRWCPKLLEWFFQIPESTLTVLSEAITDATQQKFPALYRNRKVTARIRGYDIVDSLRSLNTEYLNTLICVRGVVLRRTVIQPRLWQTWYQCTRCGCDTNGPYERRNDEKVHQRNRPRLVCEDCQSHGPFVECREKLIYENYQRLTIQEPPSQVIPGYVPKQKQVVVLGSLVDTAKPGDEVVLTGVYKTSLDIKSNAKSGFPIFGTQIIANNIERQREVQMAELTDNDLEMIHKLSRNKFIREKIIDSIAPSIWGHRHIKTGLAYVMLGGVPRQASDGHSIRGDINFLILGDPGVGKSQFLKYVEKTFHRTILTTGKGSTAVGLTAAIRRDEVNGEWYLEGGALVLADQGICLIDEFDKMADQDRVSIHEAMEQQSISISKAGIVSTLKARCSVIAAANPLMGRYNNSLTLSQNVDLSDPILSRFDILAVVKDQIHPVVDEQLAEHVVSTHASPNDPSLQNRLCGYDPDADENLIDVNAEWVTGIGRIPQPILRKYILYARRNCFPEMRSNDYSMLSQFYGEIRQVSSTGGGGLPITVRHLESVMRMACANARMRLSPYVDKRDMNFAISTMVESFIQSQKYAIATQLGKRFGRYRALAASPEEFIENILLDLMSRNTSKILQSRRVVDSDPIAMQEALSDAEVILTHLVTLVKTMFMLPEAAVTRYVESNRFEASFVIAERTTELGEKQKYIKRLPNRPPMGTTQRQVSSRATTGQQGNTARQKASQKRTQRTQRRR